MKYARQSPTESLALFLYLQRKGWNNFENWIKQLDSLVVNNAQVNISSQVWNILKTIHFMISTAQEQANGNQTNLRAQRGSLFSNNG